MEKQALAGVKVLDFGWAVVGGLSGKYLADHGAQVILVESITRPSFLRTTRYVAISKATNLDDKPWFTHLNSSKYSITLNLKHPRAREVADRLIRWADVVLENFAPGTMSRLGYDYEYMRKINPDIIMVSGSAYGQTGPLEREATLLLRERHLIADNIQQVLGIGPVDYSKIVWQVGSL